MPNADPVGDAEHVALGAIPDAVAEPEIPEVNIAFATGRGQGLPLAEARLPNGSIRFYRTPQGGKFTVVCSGRGHTAKCCFHRGRYCRDPVLFPASGRPLGFMAAWLKLDVSKDQHLDPLLMGSLSFQDRHRARRELLFLPGGPHVMAWERKRRKGEPEEPPTMQGLVLERP